ncbi:hypothetical protein APS56_14655 [Pseudalgibacter alginicilyticus]|uniref:TsaA-like domain-containing protein n=1 Tax=Pseudalgibacter alginicilyticus TaxID=1736674 RepID=A0A0P0D831_9FLAO|nr:TrmO family methyltransferase [Pseudalgibacter alginicilyticus]ALJ06299.1 hypothetical protein APS56_14655 [Pseudalgibacter alginicilyticus]
MKNSYVIQPIGRISYENNMCCLHLDKTYISGIKNLNGFKYLQIIWWGHLNDNPKSRSTLIINKPYKTAPKQLGVFATRSDSRPNPILITTIEVIKIDEQTGEIYTPYIDAEDGTFILNIKPYHKMERVKDCVVPGWCKHWPEWYEDTESFNWKDEFSFEA